MGVLLLTARPRANKVVVGVLLLTARPRANKVVYSILTIPVIYSTGDEEEGGILPRKTTNLVA